MASFSSSLQSGTTGNPKGAQLSHKNLVNCSYLITYLNNLAKENRICCCPIPIFHGFGLVEGTIAPLVSAGQTVFPSFFPDPLAVMKSIHENRCTAIKGPPVIFNDIINHPERSKFDLSSLEYVLLGASPIPRDLLIKIQDILKVKNIIIGYGLTESG